MKGIYTQVAIRQFQSKFSFYCLQTNIFKLGKSIHPGIWSFGQVHLAIGKKGSELQLIEVSIAAILLLYQPELYKLCRPICEEFYHHTSAPIAIQSWWPRLERPFPKSIQHHGTRFRPADVENARQTWLYCWIFLSADCRYPLESNFPSERQLPRRNLFARGTVMPKVCN